ncbi:preprotein translocase subunit YajC [Okibacterium sp. HSC-33S16]|uniref:preprotein translocase subunit YajC n=1 Tax=Okibacterium sp. HSC-33S16 TaxID=2910965 RepID=UPI00209EFFC3|nr:preprotein translocase subunit YajC [Okibacterium sp. HSC-33S16]MCP2030820.1 preprotein translocase subunit YajC [Okibacterium sp. HSC-33S16]
MDPLTIGMLVILAVLIFFMFRNGQKRKKDQEALLSKVVPGADVMTTFGLFGTILEMDDDTNKVLLETSPGTVLTVHRQAIAKVVEDEPVVAADDADVTVIDDTQVEPAPGLPTEFDASTDVADSRDKRADQ